MGKRSFRKSAIKGQVAEDRFVRIMNQRQFWPQWFTGARAGSALEDYGEKTDAVVSTTSGEFRIQIKSGAPRNTSGKNKVLLKELGIILLYVQPQKSDSQIRTEALLAIQDKMKEVQGNPDAPKPKPVVSNAFGTSLGSVFDALVLPKKP